MWDWAHSEVAPNRATAQPRNRATAQPRNRAIVQGLDNSPLPPSLSWSWPGREPHPDTIEPHLRTPAAQSRRAIRHPWSRVRQPQKVGAYAYLNLQSEQTGGQSGATTDRGLLETKVKEVADLRRQLQYAVDTIWPASKKINAGVRAEFKFSHDRAMK